MCVARGIPRFFVSFIKKRKGAFILVLLKNQRFLDTRNFQFLRVFLKEYLVKNCLILIFISMCSYLLLIRMYGVNNGRK